MHHVIVTRACPPRPVTDSRSLTLGTLVYDGKSAVITVDDRVLAHLRIVILAKFRRQESFSFSWTVGIADGSGRGTVWMGPGIPVYFQFDGTREPLINRAWVEVLMAAASSPAGLSVIPEPESSATAG